MPRYCSVRPSCTVSRPRTMSKWYVELMAMMPAKAPANMRSPGVSVPSPDELRLLLDSVLHAGACSLPTNESDHTKRKHALSQLAIESGTTGGLHHLAQSEHPSGMWCRDGRGRGEEELLQHAHDPSVWAAEENYWGATAGREQLRKHGLRSRHRSGWISKALTDSRVEEHAFEVDGKRHTG